jgi:hypothetical protein
VVNGPLIPGLREFDGPKRRIPRVVWWAVVLVVASGLAIVLAGVFASSGPMRGLGLVSEELQPVAYRPTTSEQALQVALALPPEGLCRQDTVDVSTTEDESFVRVTATRTSARSGACAATGSSGDRMWVDVQLAAPLGERRVVASTDSEALPRDTSAGLG